MQQFKILETRKINEILTVKDDGTEGVRNIKYLWNLINNTDCETEEVNARSPAANKAYSSLHITVRSKEIH
jgi:hypothetical protein